MKRRTPTPEMLWRDLIKPSRPVPKVRRTANAQESADAMLRALVADDDECGTYARITESPSFQRAVQIIAEHHALPEAWEKVQGLAHTIIYATLTRGRPLTRGSYDADEWAARRDEARDLLLQVAEVIGRRPAGVVKNRESVEVARRYLSPGAIDLTAPERVRELAKHDLLAQAIESLAENVGGLTPAELCPNYIHVRSTMTPTIKPSTAGTRGRAKASVESANRGTIICGIDPYIPRNVTTRLALIRDLVILAGLNCDSHTVSGVLKSRRSRKD